MRHIKKSDSIHAYNISSDNSNMWCENIKLTNTVQLITTDMPTSDKPICLTLFNHQLSTTFSSGR